MKASKEITIKFYDSPLGTLLLGSLDDRLCLCDWRTLPHSQKIDQRLQSRLSATYRESTNPVIEWAQIQLDDYFTGKRKSFELPLYLSGTDFQLSVWNELIQIPYGNTISYAELARRIGRPTAIRAVANANNANPLSVFIPCHRVIGSNRELVGYGGGLAIKEQLLRLETGMKSLWNE